MKKILAILIVGILVAGVSSASAIFITKAGNFKPLLLQNSNKLLPKTVDKLSTGGNFAGQFAKKNESGYIILGSVEGTYNKSSNYTGTFEGVWNTTDGNMSGNMSGWFWGHFFMGQIEQNETSNWFVGLYRVNETESEFGAVAIIFGPYAVRYAAGTYT